MGSETLPGGCRGQHSRDEGGTRPVVVIWDCMAVENMAAGNRTSVCEITAAPAETTPLSRRWPLADRVQCASPRHHAVPEIIKTTKL